MSYATGYLPPAPGQLVPMTLNSPFQFLDDPKRPGEGLVISPLKLTTGGSPNLGAERASTFVIGAIVKPAALRGLRVSLDYTRISKSNEITAFTLSNYQFFIDHESDYPARISRLPMPPTASCSIRQ